jgi:LacI family transcriptional regulator
VLSGKRPVAPATRARVEAAIEALRYQPNLLASALVSQRSRVLSIVVSELRDLGYYGYLSALEGIQRRANELGYSLMLHFVRSTDPEEIRRLLDTVNGRKSDGILWAIHESSGSHRWVDQIAFSAYPPMVFLNMHPNPALDVVTVNNVGGAKLAATHLAAQGAKRIGLVAGPEGWWESEMRRQGWQAALLEAGLEPAASLTAAGDWSAESGKIAMRQLLANRPELDAVFCSNDTMALGALHTIVSLGRTVPHQILLAGFDDTPEASSFCPALTSVRQDLTGLGEAAVNLLQERIYPQDETGSQPRQILIEPELVIRDSSRRG